MFFYDRNNQFIVINMFAQKIIYLCHFWKKTVQELTLFLWFEQEIKNFQEFLI